MNKCKCGCGADAPEGKGFLPGHWSKWNAKNKANGEQPKPEEPKQPEEIGIAIYAVQAMKSENVAWFRDAKGEFFRELEFYCVVSNTKECSNHVAVIREDDGMIVPAVLMPGFIGVFSKYHKFEESEKEEISPTQLEIMDGKPLPPEEKPAISQPDEPKDDDSEALRKLLELPKPEKKQGWVDRFIHGATG